MQLHQTIEKVAGRDRLIHNRLALLELISEVAEASQEERITASHANPITQLPQRTLTRAFAQCWWND
jgi:ParB family transcriptional regulator, chromosome partitioning protein